MTVLELASVTWVTDPSAGGQSIARRRNELGLSQAGLAEEAGVSAGQISRLENGHHIGRASTQKVLATLTKLERRSGIDDPDHIVNVIDLPDGTRVMFTGSAEGVADAAARFLSERGQDPDGTSG